MNARLGLILLVNLATAGSILGAEELISGTDESSSIRIFVSLQPQVYLVRQIGGDVVQVEALVTQGQDPHVFEPTPRQLTELSKAQVYFRIGLPFETRLLSKIQQINKKLLIIDASGYTVPLEADAETNGSDSHHHHGGESDPHTWLAPEIIRRQVGVILASLTALQPLHAKEFEVNHDNFINKLNAIDIRIKDLLSPYKGKAFYVFHPAFGHFADSYGLHQVAIEFEGKTPGARALAETITKARADGIKTIFVQPQNDKKPAESVAGALNANLVNLDPLAYDVLANLQDITHNLLVSFQ